MTTITTALIKATVGLPLNQSKGRKVSSEQIKDGDITDPKFLEMIVREIDTMVRQMRRPDLSMSMNCFREGVVHLFKLFYTVKTGENNSATSLAEGMQRLKLTDLGDANKGALSNAKEAFNMACAKATEAFSSEHVWPVRVEAMVLRVAATILQRVDNLEAVLAPCKLCLEEFHSIPYVKEKFEEICDNHKAGQRMRGGLEIISTVHQVNRLIYDVTQTVGKDAHIGSGLLWLLLSGFPVFFQFTEITKSTL